MEECVFSGDDESQMTSVSYTPRSGEFELNENFIILESDEKSNFRPKYDTYEISASFFCRLLSLVYFISFMGNLNQVLGLFGRDGIYDIFSNTSSFLKNLNDKSFYEALTEFPSIFLVMPISDFTLKLVPLVGMVTSFLMFLTGFNCMYSFLFLWILKLSMVALFKTLPKTVSDLMLLEVGFLSIFIFSPFKFFDRHSSLDVPNLVKWSFRFLTYRVVLLSGVYKVFLLKKVNIQHILMSIPLPTFFNYYLVGLVSNYKFLNVLLTSLLMFFEVVLSVFLVTPYRSCRLFGGVSTLVYSLAFTLLGNLGPFYFLLLLCSLFCLDDQFLGSFAKWKYNPFSKSDQLMKKVSIDLVDNVFDNYPQVSQGPETDPLVAGNEVSDEENQISTVRIVNNASDVSDNDSDRNSFGSVYLDRILSNLNYSRHRDYIREFMDFDSKGSDNLFSECFKKVLKDFLLLFYLTVILVLTFLLFLFTNYRGLKALLLFLFCILLKSHCEAVKTKITFLQGQYTFFFLQSFLLFEMLKNGPNTWSFLLWIGLVELQLNMSKKIDNLNYLTKMIIQSFLFIHLLLYNTRIMHSSFREVLVRPPKLVNNPASMMAHRHPSFGTSLNSFFSVNNYKNVYPVGEKRFEVVLQGTTEQYVTKSTRWMEFYFKQKPSKLNKFPHFVPLYQFTLDEQLVTSFNTNYYAVLYPDANVFKDSFKVNKTEDKEEKEVKKKYIVNSSSNNDEKNLSKNDDLNVGVNSDSTFNTENDTQNSSNGSLKDNNEDATDNLNSEGSSVVSETPENPGQNGDKTPKNLNKENLNKNLNGSNKVNPIYLCDMYIFGLIKKLLVGSEEVNRLLLYNPFERVKPKYVRMLLFKYKFNNLQQVKLNDKNRHNWYSREFVGELVPPLSYTPPKVPPKVLSDKNKKDNKTLKNKDKKESKDDKLKDKSNNLNEGVNNSNENGTDESQSEEGEGSDKYDQVVHVVHTMPPANNDTVPLNMAESFNHKIPNVDGMVITTK